ncbi:O79 family O-antigen polymerase [Escherichia fergusonii]|uniref:O79 family O-antigen polymerase n=1 Tax=Escherichia fergusonii TaxID=564 RepID=UPI0015EEAD21|nr:O79 family O-antigen polymerase [Escherichia fergusonii]QMI38182.1 O79 family O-antigen polymerase [Escherichia fergusonii]QMI42245.1 O79 family O-antigen polymerase [Escherichia fergusonii]
MRVFLYVLILYLSVWITNEYSILSFPIEFNFLYLLPQILLLSFVYAFITRAKKKSHQVDILEWVIPITKLSIVLSLIVLIITLPANGRDAKLEIISNNIVLYYLNMFNSSMLIVILSSMFQPCRSVVNKKVFFYIIFAIIAFSLTNLSRSMAFYFIIAICMSGLKFDIEKKKIISWGMVLIVVMILMPIFQGRTDNVEGALARSILNIVFYVSYSFGLGEYLIKETHLSGISWGYFGYVLSKILNEPLTSNIFFDNKYLYEFIQLGKSDIYGLLNANVMYPLWATVYADFGMFSFIPYLFTFFIIVTSYFMRAYILFSWLFFRFAILGFLVSPVLFRDVVFEIVVVLAFEIFIRKNKRICVDE